MKAGKSGGVPRWVQNLYALILFVLAVIGLVLFYEGGALARPPLVGNALTGGITYLVVMGGIALLSAIGFRVWPEEVEGAAHQVPFGR